MPAPYRSGRSSRSSTPTEAAGAVAIAGAPETGRTAAEARAIPASATGGVAFEADQITEMSF